MATSSWILSAARPRSASIENGRLEQRQCQRPADQNGKDVHGGDHVDGDQPRPALAGRTRAGGCAGRGGGLASETGLQAILL